MQFSIITEELRSAIERLYQFSYISLGYQYKACISLACLRLTSGTKPVST